MLWGVWRGSLHELSITAVYGTITIANYLFINLSPKRDHKIILFCNFS